MMIELKDYQSERLKQIAEEQGLTSNEVARLILVSGINWRFRNLRIKELEMDYFKQLVEGE